MPHIVLTDEQARILKEAEGPVDIRDSQGRPLASCTPLTPEELEIIEHAKRVRAAGRPGIPSARVQAFLRKLDELDRAGKVDQAQVDQLLQKVVSGEPL